MSQCWRYSVTYTGVTTVWARWTIKVQAAEVEEVSRLGTSCGHTHTHTRENKSVFEERSQPQLQLLHTFTEYLLWILTQPPLKCQDFCWVMCLSGTEIKHSTCEHFNLSPCFTALRPNCYFTVFLITGYLSASVTMTVRCRMFKPIPNFWMGFWDGRKHRTFYYSNALFLAWLLSNTSTGGQCWHLFFKVNIIEKYLIV